MQRGDSDPDCSAVVRISGIPIHQFKLKDISRNGTCFLVAEDSAILRHLHVGQEIEIRFQSSAGGSQATVFHRSEIVHITKSQANQFDGFCMVGVRILSELKFR